MPEVQDIKENTQKRTTRTHPTISMPTNKENTRNSDIKSRKRYGEEYHQTSKHPYTGQTEANGIHSRQ